MKIIDITTNTSSFIINKPLFIIKDIMIFEKMVFDEDDNNHNSVFYKYDLNDKKISTLDIYNCDDINIACQHTKDSIFYIGAVENEDMCKYNVYISNIQNNLLRKIKEIEFEKKWTQGWYIEDSRIIFESRFQVVPLNEKYIIYLIDNVNEVTECYDQSSATNEYKLFLHDLEENKSYEVLDKAIYENGLKYYEIFKVNDVEYLLIKSSIIPAHHKEQLYNCKNDKEINKIRGIVDSIKILQLESFIKEIKNNNKSITYNEIEKQGLHGSIRSVIRYNSYLYYEVVDFKNKVSCVFCYDINMGNYEKKVLDYKYNKIVSYRKNLYAITKEKDFTIFKKIFGDTDDLKYPNEIGDFCEFADNTIVITQKCTVVGGRLKYYCYIYDTSSNIILKELKGRLKFFEKNNLLIVY